MPNILVCQKNAGTTHAFIQYFTILYGFQLKNIHIYIC